MFLTHPGFTCTIDVLLRITYSHPHFTDEETETQRSKVIRFKFTGIMSVLIQESDCKALSSLNKHLSLSPLSCWRRTASSTPSRQNGGGLTDNLWKETPRLLRNKINTVASVVSVKP